MDFNDIQNAWNNEKTDNVILPDNLEKIKAASTPIDKIKKNLRNDLIGQSLAVIIIGFVPLLYHFKTQMFVPFYLLYSMFVAVCIYYLGKLYFFYKRLNNITLKTKDSLYETYFDIRLNMELYKTFGFAIVPFVVLFLIGLFYMKLSKSTNMQSLDFSNSELIAFFASVAFSILFMGLALEWSVHFLYGKYAKQIRNLLDELKEE